MAKQYSEILINNAMLVTRGRADWTFKYKKD